MTAIEPVAPQAHRQEQCPVRVVAHGPVQRDPQVVVVDVEHLWALDDHAVHPLRIVGDRQFEEVLAVSGLELLRLPGGDEPLPGQLSNGLK
jgi:hypothetical protein